MKRKNHTLHILLLLCISIFCLFSCFFLPIDAASNINTSTDGSTTENLDGTITINNITYRQRPDGYYDVIACDKDTPYDEEGHTFETYSLSLEKNDITKAFPGEVEEHPYNYVASIADEVFRDTTFFSIYLYGGIEIGSHAFENTTVTGFYTLEEDIPLGVFVGSDNTSIGDYAFAGATFTNEVRITASSIGDYAFANTNLTNVTLPDQLVSLGTMAFPNVESLTITIPDTVTNITDFHLESYTNITFYVSNTNPAYTQLEELGLKTEVSTEDPQTPSNSTQSPPSTQAPSTTTAAPMPETTTQSPSTTTALATAPQPPNTTTASATTQTAAQTTNVPQSPKSKLITCKNAVYKITGTSTVSFLRPTQKNVTNLTIPAQIKAKGKTYKVTQIADKACFKYTRLKQVTLGKNITKVGNSAFAQCRALRKITFGANVKTLGKRVLYKDTKLKKIKFKSKKLKSIGKGTFFQIPKSVNIEVPTSKVSHYIKLINKAK